MYSFKLDEQQWAKRATCDFFINDIRKIQTRVKTMSFTDSEGVLRWTISEKVVPSSYLKEACYVVTETQKQAEDKELKEFFASYKQAQSQRTQEQIEEEKMMASAAFGPGQKVVNIITGETYTTR